MNKQVTILAIESSCDETSAAVVVNGCQILSCIVSSQIPIHQRFGGVVPEIAARAHVEQINTVIEQALCAAYPIIKPREALIKEIDYLAVTHGPGLIGSLLVGVNAAKTLSMVFNKPLIPVNHILGHVYSNFLQEQENKCEMRNAKCKSIENTNYNNSSDTLHSAFCILHSPFITLVASGGHTDLILTKGHNNHQLIAHTRDDAAGEAFDKAAQLLSLSYPGGPSIAKSAINGNPEIYNLPRGLSKIHTLDFSFSGLKTALSQLINEKRKSNINIPTIAPDLASSFQESIIDSLVSKTVQAAIKYDVKNIFLAGGVAANTRLRTEFANTASLNNLIFHAPLIEYCTDNAAMIGAAAYGSVLLKHYESCYDVNVTREAELKL
jgi:N6-L-threonylcarbamoyladenine synthase